MQNGASQSKPIVAVAGNFLLNTLVNNAVAGAFRGAANAFLTPAKLALDISIAAATTATTYLILTTGSLAINGTVYLVKKTADGASYLLFKPASTAPMIAAPNFGEDGPLAPASPRDRL